MNPEPKIVRNKCMWCKNDDAIMVPVKTNPHYGYSSHNRCLQCGSYTFQTIDPKKAPKEWKPCQ